MRFALAAFLLLWTSFCSAQPPRFDTLHGRVFAGYQGWFAPTVDGKKFQWIHFGHGGKFEPGVSAIDLWPDTTGFDPDERIPTDFRHADGRVAYVFSSANPKTVGRHFGWMKEYGIDGVFLQRFGVSVAGRGTHVNKVLENVRQAAQQHGRSWSIMYDLSGLRKGQIKTIVMEDWKRLVQEMKILGDPNYQHHNSRPVVTVWGIGFNDGRDYTLEECLELVRFLKSDLAVGRNTVMVGVPYYWRELKADAVRDPILHQIISESDIVSPWAVGRYARPQDVARRLPEQLTADAGWLKERKIEYLPVIFPGFTWHNLMKLRNKEAPSNAIQRLKGQFLWSQAVALRKSGIDMAYIAMFDEIDEGTAIMKISNDPPVGASPFVGTEGLPSDQYLWLAGQVRKLLKQEIPATDAVPAR